MLHIYNYYASYFLYCFCELVCDKYMCVRFNKLFFNYLSIIHNQLPHYKLLYNLQFGLNLQLTATLYTPNILNFKIFWDFIKHSQI